MIDTELEFHTYVGGRYISHDKKIILPISVASNSEAVFKVKQVAGVILYVGGWQDAPISMSG